MWGRLGQRESLQNTRGEQQQWPLSRQRWFFLLFFGSELSTQNTNPSSTRPPYSDYGSLPEVGITTTNHSHPPQRSSCFPCEFEIAPSRVTQMTSPTALNKWLPVSVPVDDRMDFVTRIEIQAKQGAPTTHNYHQHYHYWHQHYHQRHHHHHKAP